MHTIRVGALAVELNEDLGGEITRVRHRGHNVLATYPWTAPVGVSRSSGYGDPKLDWLSDYRGGWQLLVPNAGAACVVAGVPLPFHGEWSRTRVTVTERAADRVVMTAGARLPLQIEREVRVAGEPDRVLVRTTVTNVSGAPVPFVWGEHPAFAVGPGDLVDLPPCEVFDAAGTSVGHWPACTGRGPLDRIDDTRPRESVHYLVGFSRGWAAIRRPHLGVALAWDVEDFPYAWLWHEIGSPGFPFYGRSSILAIEPASSWPGSGLADAVGRGQAILLPPHGSRTAVVALIPFQPDGRAVRGASVTGALELAS